MRKGLCSSNMDGGSHYWRQGSGRDSCVQWVPLLTDSIVVLVCSMSPTLWIVAYWDVNAKQSELLSKF